LGQVAWRKGKIEQARTAFRKAVELKPESWSVYWDYARLTGQDKSEQVEVLAALRRTVELNPEHVDAQLQLGHYLSQMERFADALAAFDAVHKVTPDRAPRLFPGKAYAAIRLENWQVARLAALNAMKYATDDRDKERAYELIAYLNRRQQAELAEKKMTESAPRSAAEGDDERPVLARTAPPSPKTLPGGMVVEELTREEPLLSRVQGWLVNVDRGAGHAVLVVQTPESKTVRLQIYDPDKITIRNEPGSTVTLTCGQQHPQPRVTVEFLDRVDEKARTLAWGRLKSRRSASSLRG